MRKSTFLANASTPENLTKAVIAQIGGWSDFEDLAQDVADHGADAGFSGFIYYSDTSHFYRSHKTELTAWMKSQAEEFGHASVFDFMASFGCLSDYSAGEIAEGIMQDDCIMVNAIAWFALEEVCRNYADLT